MNIKQEYGLPNSMYGKTFAEASKQLEKTFKNRNSVIDLRTKKELMSRLKDVQEVERQKLEEANGMQQQMALGGGIGDAIQGGFSMQTQPTYDSYLGLSSTGVIPNEQPSWLNRNFGQNSWANKNSDSILGGIGLAASALGPLLSNRSAMKNLKMPETLKTSSIDQNQYQPNLVNRQQLLRNAEEQSASQRYAIGQTGGNYAQQSAMMGNLNANRLMSTGNIMLQSDLADAQEKARIQGLRGNIQQFNIQQQDRTNEINSQNQAAYYSTLAAYKQAQGANIGAIGQSLFNLMQAKKYGREMGNVYGFRAINGQQQGT
jgi:hypothetical protein